MTVTEKELESQPKQTGIFSLPRNVWAVSLTSFFMDVSSEMVINILPLFLANVLGVKTDIIGVIEGVADATASILKLFSGWLSDKVGGRKWWAVAGYGFSALSKPFFYFANTWGLIAGTRWADRVGKGIRTAPRDALVADSVDERQRGLAFGFHRAADTGGAMVGLLIALLVIWLAQANQEFLKANTFRTIVLISIIPAILAVISLVVIARDVPVQSQRGMPKFGLKALGRPFLAFLGIVSLFTLGNSSDAFLVLRAQERGLSLVGILAMLATFNLVYALISTPAGSLSDRVGRKRLIVIGWGVYGLIYLGFALAHTGAQIFVLYTLYGLHYGMTYGTANALVADLVPAQFRGTAYGTYNAIIGILAFPASVIAGVLWQGVGTWAGFGPSAPFLFGSALALLAALLMLVWKPAAPAAG
ncbi:MAG TPA: MFS transporter [Anaerolineaceae bacterium]